MMIIPNTVVVNIMACRVFRNVKFGRHDTPSARTPVPHSLSHNRGETSFYDIPIPSGASHMSMNTRSHAGLTIDEGKGQDLGRIEITKVIELTHDYSGPPIL